MCIYTHINTTDIVKIVHEDYTVLTPKAVGEASLQLLAACIPLTFVSVIIPAKYICTYQRDYIVIFQVSGLYMMLPWL